MKTEIDVKTEAALNDLETCVYAMRFEPSLKNADALREAASAVWGCQLNRELTDSADALAKEMSP